MGRGGGYWDSVWLIYLYQHLSSSQKIYNIRVRNERQMIFIIFGKFKKKPTKDMLAQVEKVFAQGAKEGIKVIGSYWTLGRYDVARIVEAPDEKTLMKHALQFGDTVSTESLVALKREDAVKLVE